MNLESKGRTVYEADLRVEPLKLAELQAAIGTLTSSDTASLVPWFGATIGGDERLVEALGMDLTRAMLSGHSYTWERPFVPGESIHASLTIADVYEKGSNQFAVLVAKFHDAQGQTVQTQQTTFIERSAK
ncbi:MaoC family dehydratase N-terminal domain-containing protein [Acidiferrimicrobium sp. IK]|uniref:MaoC family dehydratase N-terminal domain-containing protein n=1 Tax=Acidiferrimicrobium sp. IK TaxID=2871700 RepID=UPI0021CB72BA|nr:MaoC family dehydratase N-terminal domain-containing protein [Acidiferrimicrobium sp. IK]MCU4186649.1 MaoC family dehydratase N-terminal domain-containing protein [Acidiferrimicrobium sp. IK]